jgi:hypothetical protein
MGSVMSEDQCICHYADIGVGMQKAIHDPDCRECNDPGFFEEPPLTPEEEERFGASAYRR